MNRDNIALFLKRYPRDIEVYRDVKSSRVSLVADKGGAIYASETA